MLKALGGAALDQVWVVTREPEVATLARSLGAELLAEPENRGHTAAVATAQAEAARQGATAFLTIPGDVPCVTAAEIRALVQALTAPPAVVFTPSRSGLGTNGVRALAAVGDAAALRGAVVRRSPRGRPGAAPRRPRSCGCRASVSTSTRPRICACCSPRARHTESGRLLASWQITERLVAAGAVARR